MKNVIKKEKDNKIEAEILLEYAKSINEEKNVLSTLDAILDGKSKNFVNYEIAEFIQERIDYVSVEMDYDVDVESDEWGRSVIAGGNKIPIGVKIKDKENLMILRQELDNILSETNKKIIKFISNKNKPKWKCQKCGRFLGKELSSVEEIKKLLRNFSVTKYWKCRSCKLPNYFSITKDGIEFKSKELD